MILTDAPNDFGGRFRRNCARTTPELPFRPRQCLCFSVDTVFGEHTMRPSDFAPDDSYLRPSNLLSRAVDEGYFLAQIESEKQGVRLRD